MKAQGAAMRPWRKMGELEIQQLQRPASAGS
jgi:hypothetical protein